MKTTAIDLTNMYERDFPFWGKLTMIDLFIGNKHHKNSNNNNNINLNVLYLMHFLLMLIINTVLFENF